MRLTTTPSNRGSATGRCASISDAAYGLGAPRSAPRWRAVIRVGSHASSARRWILHISDIQTPTIGEREEHALRAGIAARLDLVVLTGDYVQDSLGRPTEERAAAKLRALVRGIPLAAPLGVFATNGDAGPACGDVFAGTPVRCLVNDGVRVSLPGGGTLSITGLSSHHGRERDRNWLAWLLARRPRADHRIVISHSPDFVDSLPAPVDLVLAGHTHGARS